MNKLLINNILIPIFLITIVCTVNYIMPLQFGIRFLFAYPFHVEFEVILYLMMCMALIIVSFFVKINTGMYILLSLFAGYFASFLSIHITHLLFQADGLMRFKNTIDAGLDMIVMGFLIYPFYVGGWFIILLCALVLKLANHHCRVF